MRGTARHLTCFIFTALMQVGLAHAAESPAAVGTTDDLTVALWLFDEPRYINMTLTDAGPNLYDLRLTDYGHLVPGRFGGALQTSASAGPAVAYPCASHSFDDRDFRSPELWENRPPAQLIAALEQPTWTVECWIKLDGLPQDEGTLIELGTPEQACFHCSLADGGNRIILRGNGLKSAVAIPVDAQVLGDGRWHHLAIVHTNATVAAYLDGQSQGSAEPAPALRAENATTPLPGLIGRITADNGQDPDQPGQPAGIKTAPQIDFFWRLAEDLNWSEHWQGTIQSPVDGEMEFWIESEDGAQLYIADKLILDTLNGAAQRVGRVTMQKNKPQPMVAILTQRSDTQHCRLHWRRPGGEWAVVPPDAFSHSVADEREALDAVRSAIDKRFYLTLGSSWLYHDPLAAQFDELRVSSVARYSGDFTVPESLSRNHGTNPHPPTVANGLPLLFDGSRGTEPIALGSRKHVFIDDVLLDARDQLRFRTNPPQQPEPTTIEISGDSSFYDEGDSIRFMSNEGKQWQGDERQSVIYMSTTKDGIHGDPPSFSHLARQGDAKRNVCLRLPLQGRVFKDPNPAAPPEARYKFPAFLMHRGVFLFTSADGIHWKRNETLMAPFDVGGGVEMYWDDQRGSYATFIRNEGFHASREPYGRAVARMETREPFKPWPFEPSMNPTVLAKNWSMPFVTTELPTAFAPQELWHKNPDHFVREGQVYRSRAIKYPWAPDTYLAFPWRLYGIYDHEQRSTDFAVSRDGVHWKWYENDYFPYGWDYNGNEVVESLSVDGLVRRGDELWQYAEIGFKLHGAVATTPLPKNVLLRYKQRLDGFVSLDADKKPGWLLTRSLLVEGDRLELNVAAKGSVRVGLYDERGAALPGFTTRECDPISDDSVRRVVSWGGNPDVSSIAGRPVRLRIEMQDAKLYAFQFVKAN